MPVIDDFSIHIAPRDGGRYKSIQRLDWDTIPGFAILTGRNGSGKTQLLELIAYFLSGAVPAGFGSIHTMPVVLTVVGKQYDPSEIAYIPSAGRFSGGAPSSISSLQGVRNQLLQHVRQAQAYINDVTQTVKSQKILKRLAGKNPHQIQEADLKDFFPEDFEFALDDVDITASLSHLFMAYRLRNLESIERNTPGFSIDGKPLGPAPWTVVNDALSASGFAYEVLSPENTPLLEAYNLKLRDRVSTIEIGALDLSSGEKTILQVVLWLFTASKDGVFPKLLILDEPDAHLHPSMTMQFLDVLSEVLVKKYAVRIIMTTHSPSTVALAPSGAIFQLERGAPSVIPVSSISDIIAVLTSGLVTVSKTTKFCFVEDEDDVSFYEVVRDILTDYGPSKDPMALALSPSIAFVPASIGAGSSKIAGGLSVVAKWIDKLDAAPLDRMFLGIIDRDKANAGTSRILKIGRYSFENYLLDSLVIFALMVEEGTAPPVLGLSIGAGNEHLIRSQPQSMLQAIVEFICQEMSGKEQKLVSSGNVDVEYTIGHKVSVPSWVIDYRGHDLLPIAQAACGGPKVINPPRLRKALLRCRMVPKELAILFAAVQAI